MSDKRAPQKARAGGAPARGEGVKKTGAKSAEPKPKPKANLDPKQIIEASFVAGAGPGSSLPAPAMAEIAFAGRSNVGKSSLINALVERKNLVRSGATPGVTRQINLFEARARDGAVFHLVDLPGYGFAKRSKAETASWKDLIEGYMRTRVTLAAVVLLVDARRGVEQDDLDLVQFVEEARDATRRPVQIVVVATKVDKVGSSSRQAALAAIGRQVGRKVVGFSAVTGEGRTELWTLLRRATLGEGAPDQNG
ncbi:ribosome biogenesis GTP-binding protein YihA/YsxC [Polyangium aurulentum]|uniref:ribosome biogenesis GTP-binding protein YihA/YsxC n=1 Tax=Polyangium aurulentum TaxID=2567896 RepID=UPI0023E0440B|nr:ribosome biogenesis GTP-binding protein YihA/YsxC [Polyangium aurulentum]